MKKKGTWKKVVIAIVAVCVIGGAINEFNGDEESIQSDNVSRNEETSVWAKEPTDIEDFEYYVDGENIYVQKYNGKDDKVYVAYKYELDGKEFSVSGLQDATFLFSDIESVIISEGITSLENNTFNSCGVQYLYLPSTLENVEDSFWGYFHDVDEIYYGGSNNQWNSICQIDRKDLEAKQIYCDVSIGDLGTDKSKEKIVTMNISKDDSEHNKEDDENEPQNPEDKFISESADYLSETVSKKLYGIIIGDLGFSEAEFIGKEASDSVWNLQCDDIKVLAVASDDVYRIWSGDYTFYEDGNVVKTKQQMEETLVKDEDKTSYYAIAQGIVLQYLKNPNSASFPWGIDEIGFEKDGDIVAVQGYVDATNSFGSQVRNQWTVEFRVSDLSSLSYETLYVNIDGQSSGTFIELG